jgi:hypothetical protein
MYIVGAEFSSGSPGAASVSVSGRGTDPSVIHYRNEPPTPSNISAGIALVLARFRGDDGIALEFPANLPSA